MKIAFIGTGYVGLVYTVMMAHIGHYVTCVDVDSNKIKKIKNYTAPIYEPRLDEYLKKYVDTEQLYFTDQYDQRLGLVDMIFITVGTPSKANGEAELQYIKEALGKAISYAKKDCLFVIKSTVPPGTCKQLKKYLEEVSPNNQFNVASNPEFLREGNAIADFLNPDRIIIGSESEKANNLLNQLYKPLTDKGVEIIHTDLNTAELIKYASNSFLASKIAFINEMADLCEVVDADVETLARGIGLDKRIGLDFLKAGPGFGGSCFPKDMLALQHLAQNKEVDILILDAIINTNRDRPNKIIAKILNILDGKIAEKNLAMLGLTYKAHTDDVRNSPAITLIKLLQKANAIVKAYDPKGISQTREYFDDIDCSDDIKDTVKNADAIIIATEWPEFKEIDFGQLRSHLKNQVIIDLRNILNADHLRNLGYRYYAIGRHHDR